MAAEICSARAGLYKSWHYFSFNLSLSLFVCLRSMLAAKMFVIQTRNYIPNSKMRKFFSTF